MNLYEAKILITCGPTWVPVDAMRVISNQSTGKLGQLVAESLVSHGARVTLLEGPVLNPLLSDKVTVKKFCFFDELFDLLQKEAQVNYDVIIHAAAVSDYQMDDVIAGKMDSDQESLVLRLKRTPKMIQSLRQWAPQSKIVGFKLESDLATAKKAGWLLKVTSDCDIVVANTMIGQYQAVVLVDDQESDVLASRESCVEDLIKKLSNL